MTFLVDEIASEGWAKHSPLARGRTVGPVTAAYQRRTFLIYASLFALGSMPWLFGGSNFLKAMGLGLWFPGAGFIASSGAWAFLLVPLVLALFALALFAWFGSGMVLAPAVVWGGAAVIAGLMPGQAWDGAPFVSIGFLVAATAYVQWREIRGRAAAAERRKVRDDIIRTSTAKVLESAAPEPAPDNRELSESDVQAIRYILDRALQPVDRFDGFDIVDQFQTASLRYQINNCGYALAEIQRNYVPNLRGYYETAQINLIEKYLHNKVWGYWAYETSWGHLNLINHDPVGKDNIMLTGWLALHLGMYMLATGDRRYLEAGSLEFRKGDKIRYQHDAGSLVSSVVGNYKTAPYCLYPCEPNWAYPICNYIGFNGLIAMDAVRGTNHADDLRDQWLEALDTEFTDESGSIVGLRSTLTGFRFPFPGGELGFVNYQETIDPHRAWRMWAIARTELEAILTQAQDGQPRTALPGRGFDFGNYRSGFGGAYAAIMAAAREFGDDDLAAAAQRALDEDCALAIEGGIRRYSKMSNLSNISAVIGQIRRRGDFRRTVMEATPPDVLRGPMLTGIKYPDVLVARAYSVDGEGIDLVLYPGAKSGDQNLTITCLAPGTIYSITGLPQSSLMADENGKIRLSAHLDGRTEIRIRPTKQLS